jgi:uncharacterized membrane protein
MTDKQCYEILEVSITASKEDIKKAYLDLIKVWHPDRFPNKDLKEKATEKLKRINAAYNQIQGSANAPNPKSKAKPSSYGTAQKYSNSMETGEQVSIAIPSSLAAAMCYLPLFCCLVGPILSLWLLIADRKNSFVRFHALQALGWSAFSVLLGSLLVGAVNFVTDERERFGFGMREAQNFAGWIVVALVIWILIFLIMSIFLAVSTNRGKKVKLPLLGWYAQTIGDFIGKF